MDHALRNGGNHLPDDRQAGSRLRYESARCRSRGRNRARGRYVGAKLGTSGHRVPTNAKQTRNWTSQSLNDSGRRSRFATLVSAVAGQDVVVSTIGVNSLKPTTLYSVGARNVVTAMKAGGISRFFGIGANAMHIDANDAPLLRYVAKPIVARILREHYADIARMEGIVENSGLDWTIVVPPRLTAGPPTGKYRTALNENVRGGKPAISRADCADYIVQHFNGHNSVSGLVFIAH